MRRVDWWRDDAVSEVVGTILLVAISVVLFSGLSLVVWNQMQTSALPANVDLRIDVDGEWVSVTHTWGESLPVGETRLLVTIGGNRSDYKLDEAPLAANLDADPSGSPDHWDLGETLWLACPSGQAEGCALPGQTVDSVTMVDARANAVIASTLPGVTQGLILSPLPDLVVATEPVGDLTPSDGMYMDCTYRFRVLVANTGMEPTPDDGTSIVTNFYLDGSSTAFHTHTRTDPLAAGATYTVVFDHTVPLSGSHEFKAVVDEDNHIEEITGDPPDENSGQRSFSLIAPQPDPGFAYEDADDDGIYAPCVAGNVNDVNNHTAIMDGDHTTAVGSGTGIVIPPSVDPISVAGPISFTPDGSLTLGVNLSATGSNGVTLNAKNKVTLLGSPAPTITATGPIDIDAVAGIDLGDATFVAEGFAVTVDSSGGSIFADGLSVPVGVSADATRLELRALGHITAQNATVYVTDAILVDASGTTTDGSLLLQNASFVADPGSGVLSGDAIRLNGNGDVHVDYMFMQTAKDLIGIDVQDATANTLHLTDLDCDTLAGAQNTVIVTPTGANADGTTARCTIVGVV